LSIKKFKSSDAIPVFPLQAFRPQAFSGRRFFFYGDVVIQSQPSRRYPLFLESSVITFFFGAFPSMFN